MANIPCRLCTLVFGCKQTFMRHMKRQHGDATEEQYLNAVEDAKWYTEHSRMPLVLCDHEAGLVGPGTDHFKFRCLGCDTEYSKTSALKHFASEAHQLDKDDVKKWVVVKDSTLLRGGWSHTHLESYFSGGSDDGDGTLAHDVNAGGNDADGGDEAVNGTSEAIWRCDPVR
jgi:hypothetical protein